MRLHIDQDEDWPVYFLTLPDEIMFKLREPNAEVPEELIEEYKEARRAWKTVQDKLRTLYHNRHE
jgi:hypothetical protein